VEWIGPCPWRAPTYGVDATGFRKVENERRKNDEGGSHVEGHSRTSDEQYWEDSDRWTSLLSYRYIGATTAL